MAYYYSPFRSSYAPDTHVDCVLCDETNMTMQGIRQRGALVENDSYRWIVNAFPKFEGHTMLVPKRHVTELGGETPAESADRESLTACAVSILKAAFPESGLELFLQTGSGSAGSVAHLHWHLVPASQDDPLRSFEKLGHFYTTEPDAERVVLFPTRIERSPQELNDLLSGAA